MTNLLRYFDTSKRTKNENIKIVTKRIEETVEFLDDFLPDGDEKTVALRKFLEGKDAACRAALDLDLKE